MQTAITALYAIPLVAIFFILWISVAAARSKFGVSIGDGGHEDLHVRIRRHGNFIEWVPFVLILMVIAESMGAPDMYIHITGALLVVGRVLHPFGLKASVPVHGLRIAGNSANLLATLNILVCLVVKSLGF